jgi:hypothetical protein
MALAPDGASIYVTRIDPSGVDRLDLTTLATTASVSFPTRTCPNDVVPAGGRIWLKLGCSAHPLASVDAALSTQAQTVPSMPTARSMAASADKTRLFVREEVPAGFRKARLTVVDATDPAAPSLATVPLDGDAAMGMRASPDGASLVVGGLPVRVLDAQTLETRTTLQSFGQVDQVVVTGDGRHVVGSSRSQAAGYERDVLWWTMGHPGQIGNVRPADPERRPRLVPSPDGRNVHILGDDGLLRLIPIGPDPSRLDVALDPGPAPGLVRVHGTLRLDGASTAGRSIVVSRATPLAPPVPLPAVTGPDGSFSIVDTVPPGAFTYRARWAGDGPHRPALAMVSGGTAAPPPLAPPTGLPDRAVLIPTNSDILLLDDVHGRLLLDQGGPPGTVTVADLEGNPTGSFALPAPVLGMVGSDAGTDLFAVLGDGAGVAVIDGATLGLAGIVSAGALVPVPSSATLIGGRLWVSGVGRYYPAEADDARLEVIDLAGPVDATAVSVGHWAYGTDVFADPSDPGFAFVRTSYDLRRLDLSTEPPTPTTTVPLYLSYLGNPVVGFADGTLVTASNRLIRDVDAATLSLRRERWTDVVINGLAPGPSPGLFAASTGAFYAPDEGGVQIWGQGEKPVSRYKFPRRSAEAITTTRDGSRAFAISRHAGSAVISPVPIPTYLHVLHDPFRPCRVVPDVLPALASGTTATVTGLLTTAGGTPQPGTVTVGIGGVSVTVPAGDDGRFTAVLVPTVLGATTVSFSVGEGLQACLATQPVTVGPFPDGPPSAPTAVTASPSRDAATVRWSPPAMDGGAAVTGYRVEATVGGSTISVTATAGQREVVVAPLSSSGPVQVTVRAGNRHGWGPTASTHVTPSRWWPFTTPAALVERQYLDILERPPTAAEASSWLAALTNGTATVSSLAVTLYYSAEATNGPLAVAQLWITGTNQFLDRATLSLWVDRLRTGTTLSTFGRTIAQHPGFTSRYGALGNRAFVDAMARDLLGAPLPATTANQWAALLAPDKLHRGDLFAFFALQPQARTRWAPWVGTDVVLLGQLGATPSPEVLFSSITRIANGSLTLPSLVDEITRSPGYGTRFGAG